jgi:hypothetical protein
MWRSSAGALQASERGRFGSAPTPTDACAGRPSRRTIQWLQEDARIASKPDRNYGRMPLIVLTSSEFPPPPPGQPGPTKAELMAEFAHEHGQIAALSTRGVDRVVEGSSHFIQQIKPQVVIDSIDEVVDAARADVAKLRK